jgi:hypothetical protein
VQQQVVDVVLVMAASLEADTVLELVAAADFVAAGE